MEIKAGYKPTEVGVVPSDWLVDYIENRAHVTTGGRNTQDRVADGEYPFFVRSQTVERINSYSFDGEAVLTAGDGVGTGKVFHYINGKFDVHQRVYRISNFCKSLDGYYFYLYFSTHFHNRIMQMTAKSSVDSVRMEMITKMPVPFPPTNEEQRAIAIALADVEALIAGLEQLIAKKRDIKQAAMQQLLAGQTRLLGFGGEWTVRQLGELGATYGGLVGKSKADFEHGPARYVPFVNVMTNVRIDCAALENVNVAASEYQNRVLAGDLLFNGSSETPEEVALCALMEQSINDVYLNSFCFGFRLKAEAAANGLFLVYLFRSQFGRELMKSLAQGSTRYNLSKAALLRIELKLPSIEEQAAIAEVLSDMDADLSALESRLDKTRAIKQGMLQELLAGRTRLV